MTIPRSEHVGSLLRPPELLAARERRSRGEIGDDELQAVEDAAVDEVLRRQEEAGIDVVTDGELRRLSFQSQLAEAVDGFGDWDLDACLWGDWQCDAVGDLRLERPPLAVRASSSGAGSSLRQEFAYARPRTDRVLKVTLPSPGLFSQFWDPERSTGAYPTLDEFLGDVAGASSREEVAELARLGATYVQLDAPHYPLLLDERWRAFYEERGCGRRPGSSSTTPSSPPRRRASPSASTSAAATRAAAGSSRAATTRSPGGSSRGSGPTGCCSSTTTSAPAASSRCARCPTTRSSCSGS